MEIFRRVHFVSKITTTAVSKQLTRTRITEGQAAYFLVKGPSKLHTACATPLPREHRDAVSLRHP